MALVFNNQGKYDKALEWFQRALDGKEKALGNDHPDTLDTVNNMALVFNNQGKYDKALEWNQRALDGCEKALGNDHPSTIGTINNMAMVFDNQGEYNKAVEWFQRALDGYEKALGNDHPSTLETVRNMAIAKGHLSTLTSERAMPPHHNIANTEEMEARKDASVEALESGKDIKRGGS
jgi:tetratricopeptide (TPR) repeat protein